MWIKLRPLRAAGLEPARPYGQGVLSALCLPFHHARASWSLAQPLGIAIGTSRDMDQLWRN